MIVATALELCKKSVVFFLKKRMKETFAYVLECMLIFDKMKKQQQYFNVEKVRNLGLEHNYVYQVVRSLTTAY